MASTFLPIFSSLPLPTHLGGAAIPIRSAWALGTMLTSFKDKDEVLLPGTDQMQQGGTFWGGARFTADLPTWRRAARLQRLASGKRAVDPWPTDRGRQRSAGGHHHEGQGDDVFFCCDGVKKGVHASQDARAERHCERRGERGWNRRLGYPLDICRWQIQMIFRTNYAFYHLLFPHGASDVAAVDTSPTPSSSL